MVHRIGRREDVDEALCRLLRDDVAKAVDVFQSGEAVEKRIHSTRQRLKRARSILRVLQPALGPAADESRRDLSAAARLIAGTRDADVAAATARNLRDGSGADGAAELDRVVAHLEKKAEEAHRQETPIDDTIARLARADVAITTLGIPVDGRRLFDRAMARAFKKGRAAMRRARLSLSTSDLHAWRKHAKHLWHLLRLGRQRLPPRTRKMAAGLSRLADLLGFDHDHAVLAERLALSPDVDLALMRHLALIADERHRLEKEAFALGRKLYKSRPQQFARHAHLD